MYVNIIEQHIEMERYVSIHLSKSSSLSAEVSMQISE